MLTLCGADYYLAKDSSYLDIVVCIPVYRQVDMKHTYFKRESEGKGKIV